MSDAEETLRKTFCEECHQRMQRVQGILAQCGAADIGAESYDRIHQEFDSLAGAARAISMHELERFNRTMASYSRFLRSKLPRAASREEKLLLYQAVELVMLCGGSEKACIVTYPELSEKILGRIEEILEKQDIK
jgi:chemotaxis protein histidine kinase CheA